MVYFQTRNPNLGNFWSAFYWKMLEYFIVIRHISRIFGILFGHMVYFCSFVTSVRVLVSFNKKNLATQYMQKFFHIPFGVAGNDLKKQQKYSPEKNLTFKIKHYRIMYCRQKWWQY
jgi:hypothetical protein